ncbi:MAG: hypothetical protein HY680_00005 [Chloroflexi bacterium]|nr:hypothetical protein [Chloroflexota bacterium]
MNPIKVRDNLKQPIGVSRESARTLQPLVQRVFFQNPSALEIDFSGMGGFTPSFFDELLSIIEESAGEANWKVDFTNVPTEFSSKFAAICRGRGLNAETKQGAWSLTGDKRRAVA